MSKVKTVIENKSVYIPNLQACDLYDHMFRGKVIKLDKYTGMLPYSIELRKLMEEGLKVKRETILKQTVNKVVNGEEVTEEVFSIKQTTDKIINVKFRMKVESAKSQIASLQESLVFHNKNLVKLQEQLEVCSQKKKVRFTKLINEKLQTIEIIESRIELMEQQKGEPTMKEMKREPLREYLYNNGFVLNGVQYEPYKRSSAKSRKGEMIFIVKSLHKKMMKWSRMNIDFDKAGKVDYASLLAYESLCMSSIIQDETGLINIKPENMLIVADIDHSFKKKVNIVRKSETDGYLEAVTDEADVKSSIFDGESLLDANYFSNTPNNSMKLLRNHFFKSCSFSCNIQQFMKDNCPEGIPFDEWKITDLFQNEIYAKDVHFIFCPSSLKCLKFADVISKKKNEIDRQSDMYDYWKKIIASQGSTFGVCKVDKISKLGVDEDDNILQQTTYQFLNSLSLNNEQVDELLSYEYERIERLKNDYDYFVEYLEEKKDITNANEMMIELYKHNPEIIHAEVFRDFKAKTINSYVEYLKKGKIKIPNADYSTICCNPIELLKASIGKFDVNNEEHIKEIALKGNEIYNPMFQDGRELVCWRNPHTSQSNVLISVNRANDEIKKYMNLSNNIVIINALFHAIQPILSGSDQDGDTMAICDNKTLLEASKGCYEKYNVSINEVASSKNKYHTSYGSAAIIDNNLAKSSLWIGRVVNENQHVLSLYWHRKASGATEKELKHLVEQIDKFTILSEISIDLAKKVTDIDVDDEIDHINRLIRYQTDDKGHVQYPVFFKIIKLKKKTKKFIKSDDTKKKAKKKLNTIFHETTMDRVFLKLSKLAYANGLENIGFDEFLIKHKKDSADREQSEKLQDITNQKLNKISEIMQGGYEKDERNLRLEHEAIYFKKKIRNLKVSKETMYVLLLEIGKKGNRMGVTLLNTLYNHDKETFMNAFKMSKKATETLE